MEQRQLVAFLNYPDAALVQHAVERANLTSPEWEAIYLREIRQETIERAAEQLDVSPGTIKNRYRAGIGKLDSCWSGLPWINSILKQ